MNRSIFVQFMRSITPRFTTFQSTIALTISTLILGLEALTIL
jgi:hypothetical protein